MTLFSLTVLGITNNLTVGLLAIGQFWSNKKLEHTMLRTLHKFVPYILFLPTYIQKKKHRKRKTCTMHKRCVRETYAINFRTLRTFCTQL